MSFKGQLLFISLLAIRVYCQTIILFGDSLTEHGFYPAGWGTKLQKLYEGEIEFINQGRGGYTTEWSLPLLGPALDQYSKDPNNPLLLTTIFLGTNDATLPNSGWDRTVPIPKYIDNLKQMIDMVLKYTKVILITPPPGDENKDGARTLANTKLYRDACLQIAIDFNIPVLDTWPLIMKPDGIYNQTIADQVYIDGVHFTPIGNDIILFGIAKLIRKVLSTRERVWIYPGPNLILTLVGILFILLFLYKSYHLRLFTYLSRRIATTADDTTPLVT
ncbi:isoamyl acetate-hydrolyzing esterase [Globomyces sp. JEL0801]|nr:isoamyl acetate-hydrolyzing esterase [Globomyces sp. JEL0801]